MRVEVLDLGVHLRSSLSILELFPRAPTFLSWEAFCAFREIEDCTDSCRRGILQSPKRNTGLLNPYS